MIVIQYDCVSAVGHDCRNCLSAGLCRDGQILDKSRRRIGLQKVRTIGNGEYGRAEGIDFSADGVVDGVSDSFGVILGSWADLRLSGAGSFLGMTMKTPTQARWFVQLNTSLN